MCQQSASLAFNQELCMIEERDCHSYSNPTVKADSSTPALVLPAGVLQVEPWSAAGRHSCSQSPKSEQVVAGQGCVHPLLPTCTPGTAWTASFAPLLLEYCLKCHFSSQPPRLQHSHNVKEPGKVRLTLQCHHFISLEMKKKELGYLCI